MAELTANNVNDNLVLPAALNGDAVLGEGAYHTKKLHREVHERGGVLFSPPHEGRAALGQIAYGERRRGVRISQQAGARHPAPRVQVLAAEERHEPAQLRRGRDAPI